MVNMVAGNVGAITAAKKARCLKQKIRSDSKENTAQGAKGNNRVQRAENMDQNNSFLRSLWGCLQLNGYTEPLPASIKRTDSLELLYHRRISKSASKRATTGSAVPLVQT